MQFDPTYAATIKAMKPSGIERESESFIEDYDNELEPSVDDGYENDDHEVCQGLDDIRNETTDDKESPEEGFSELRPASAQPPIDRIGANVRGIAKPALSLRQQLTLAREDLVVARKGQASQFRKAQARVDWLERAIERKVVKP